MGKVISKIYHWVVHVVKKIASNKIGAIVMDVVGGVLLGPIGVAGATLIQKASTQDKIKTLKDQIRNILQAHQSDVDDTNNLKDLTTNGKLFDKKAFDGIINLGSLVKGNLSAIFKTQKQKIDSLKSIDLVNGEKQKDYDTTGQSTKNLEGFLMDTGRLAADAIALAVGISSGDILTAGLAIADMGLNIYQNIKEVFTNISQIEKLEEKKKQIEQYFMPGGQFQKHMDIASNYTIDLVNNLVSTAILWNNLLQQLYAWLEMIQILNPTINKSYCTQLIKQLNKSSVDQNYIIKLQSLLTSLNKVFQSTRGVIRVHSLFQKLKAFQNQNKVQEIFTQIEEILPFFAQGSMSYSLLSKYIEAFKDITFQIQSNQGLFSNVSFEGTYHNDSLILQTLQQRVSVYGKLSQQDHQKIKQAKIAIIISSYRKQFYAQDKAGKLIYNYSIEQLNRQKGIIRFLDSSTGMNGNTILIPQPLSSDPEGLKEYWRKIYFILKNDGISQSYRNYDLYQFFKEEKYWIKDKSNSRVILYIQVINKNDSNKHYEMLYSDFIVRFTEEQTGISKNFGQFGIAI